MIDNPIFITGIPRSGISMTANLIDMNGAYGGNTDSRYSNKRIVDKILNPYFMMLGDVNCQRNVPTNSDIISIDGMREQLIDIMEQQGYENGRWYIKDARLILMHSLLDTAFPGADWILVKRDKNEIAQSCMKTGYMDAYNKLNDWLDWISKWENIYMKIQSNNFNMMEVYPKKFINDDNKEINHVLTELGLV